MNPSLSSARDLATLRSFASRIDPADAGAHNNLGVLYHRKGLHEEAVAAFTRALELDPRMHVAQRNLEIAYFDTGYYERRIALLREQVRANENDRAARWELGRTHAMLGQLAEAFAELEALLERDPNDTRVLVQLAITEQGAGDLTRAQAWLERALAIAPDDPSLVFKLGEVLYNRGLSEPALELLERAVRLAPEHADAHYLLGFVLGDLGRHDEARTAARRAMQLNPSLAKARANLALEKATPAGGDATPSLMRRVTGAVARPELEVSQGGQLAHFSLGLAFRAKGYWSEALREYRAALDKGEDRALVLQAMAELYLLRREAPAAAQLYARLVAERDDSPKLWNEYGVALHQSARSAEAIEAYRRSLALDESYVIARNNLGVALQHAGDAPRARRAFEVALAMRPAFAKAALNLGLLLHRAGDGDGALACYRDVLRHEPESALAWNAIGTVLASARNHAEARTAFSRAIEARPDYASALYNLSFALSNLGDFDGALRATKRALELEPYYVPQSFALAIDLEFEDPDLAVPADLGGQERTTAPLAGFAVGREQLDEIFGALAPEAPTDERVEHPYAAAADALAARRWDDAAREAERALAAGADRVEGLTLLGDAYVGRGALGEALDRYRAARADAPGAHAPTLGAVRTLLALGRGAEARPLADALAERHPMDVEVLLLTARARTSDGDEIGARRLLGDAQRAAPERPDVLASMADTAQLVGDASLAADLHRRALALEPTLVASRLSLALLLERERELDEAARELARAATDAPTDAEIARSRARVERALGRVSESITVLVDLLRRDPYDLEGLVSLAESLLHEGRVSDATVALARVRRFDAEHVGALYFEGAAAAERHRWREAIDCWRRVVELEPASEYARRARRDARTAADLERIFTSSAA